MKHNIRIPLALALITFIMTSTALAFADCQEMGNATWNELSVAMAQAYDNGNYDEALENGKRLTLICNRSPIVNFTMSEIYRHLENEQESYNYAKRATEYLQDYPVPLVLAERMWMRRAENELPYKKQLEDLQNQLATGTGEYGSQQTELQTNLYTSEMKLEHERQRQLELYHEELKTINTTKWIGGGTAIGGLVVAAVGAGLMGKYYTEASDQYRTDWKAFDNKDSKVHAGIALVAGGVGLGLAGSAVAIYAFLKENRLQSKYDAYMNRISEDSNGTQAVSLTFDVSPNAVAFGMTF